MRTRIRPVGPDVHVRGGVTDTSAGSGQRPAGAPDRTTVRFASSPVVPVTGLSPTRRP
jgi:hypothetical protein